MPIRPSTYKISQHIQISINIRLAHISGWKHIFHRIGHQTQPPRNNDTINFQPCKNFLFPPRSHIERRDEAGDCIYFASARPTGECNFYARLFLSAIKSGKPRWRRPLLVSWFTSEVTNGWTGVSSRMDVCIAIVAKQQGIVIIYWIDVRETGGWLF